MINEGQECLKSYDPHNLLFSVDILLNPISISSPLSAELTNFLSAFHFPRRRNPRVGLWLVQRIRALRVRRPGEEAGQEPDGGRGGHLRQVLAGISSPNSAKSDDPPPPHDSPLSLMGKAMAPEAIR